jgi:hypothetical protein
MMKDMSDKDLFSQLAEAVTTMKPELVAELARKVLELGLSPEDAMTQVHAGSTDGREASAKECFVPRCYSRQGRCTPASTSHREPQAAPGNKGILGVVQATSTTLARTSKVMAAADLRWSTRRNAAWSS